ncbi:MAG TPA: UDP-N-acetylglucosamine 2-epimerase (non-hydrolyzing) [Anaerolineales bacterium]|nr:UDP-N-acetylglucosamine 2-epimerase (non-hydrolyzing) [Anaerolineales bacterium]
MKILTVLGTRPEIIRLSRIIEKLDATCEHLVVHTGQNYDPNLNDVFFNEMNIRQPNIFLGAKGSFGEVVGMILAGCEQVMRAEKPDKFLVLGDTNSALAAFIAKRLGIPVYHMEAGNRCYDDRVPEEVNRRVIDHSSDVLMPYTERSRQNLLREGIPGERVFVTGNPILEVITHYESQIHSSNIHKHLLVHPQEYFLVTLHRAENVDLDSRLHQFVQAIEQIGKKYQMPVVVSTHPHTRNRMQEFGVDLKKQHIHFMDPFGFFDFVYLERNAFCVLSDSGTVQEECAIFKVPNVTLRDVTERPETIECGSNILSGVDAESINRCVELVVNRSNQWRVPPEYLADNVSDTVVKILHGYLWS